MATVPHVTSGLGLRKFQADGFLLTRVYILQINECWSWIRSTNGHDPQFKNQYSSAFKSASWTIQKVLKLNQATSSHLTL